MKTRSALPALALVALAVLTAACSGTGASPGASSPAPSPTSIVVKVETPEDAATLALATDPRLAGAVKLSPDLIGGSKWWEAEALEGGGYKVTVTAGWGDCPAGCINRHVWVFEVTASGQVTLTGESGDPVPAGSFPPG